MYNYNAVVGHASGVVSCVAASLSAIIMSSRTGLFHINPAHGTRRADFGAPDNGTVSSSKTSGDFWLYVHTVHAQNHSDAAIRFGDTNFLIGTILRRFNLRLCVLDLSYNVLDDRY